MTATDLNQFLQKYPGTSRIRLNPADYGTLAASFGNDGDVGNTFAGNLGSGLSLQVPVTQDAGVPPGEIQGD